MAHVDGAERDVAATGPHRLDLLPRAERRGELRPAAGRGVRGDGRVAGRPAARRRRRNAAHRHLPVRRRPEAVVIHEADAERGRPTRLSAPRQANTQQTRDVLALWSPVGVHVDDDRRPVGLPCGVGLIVAELARARCEDGRPRERMSGRSPAVDDVVVVRPGNRGRAVRGDGHRGSQPGSERHRRREPAVPITGRHVHAGGLMVVDPGHDRVAPRVDRNARGRLRDAVVGVGAAGALQDGRGGPSARGGLRGRGRRGCREGDGGQGDRAQRRAHASLNAPMGRGLRCPHAASPRRACPTPISTIPTHPDRSRPHLPRSTTISLA